MRGFGEAVIGGDWCWNGEYFAQGKGYGTNSKNGALGWPPYRSMGSAKGGVFG
jgi:hypothetical protein